ncbi:hypothetical protein [Gordonia tangerina]|uniref:Uncharacterized protein n=1 Tax=Gordonia tangerina TaxID=2911060 RepID=A0ABS9DH41_9ACTN|nr:hypothetical protein [Gordonia tangerina]MCF3938466.1 hypothetical protein [Gordonia tangerina]
MLTLALAATLVGFVLLVLGLITGTVWLAISCIVVCLAGLGFLIADVVGAGRRGDDEPTLADFVDSDQAEGQTPDGESGDRGTPADRRIDDEPVARPHSSVPQSPTPESPVPQSPTPPSPTPQAPIPPSQYGSAAAPTPQSPVPPPGPPGVGRHGRAPQSPTQAGVGRDGGYDDYLRSVGGYPAPQPAPGTHGAPTGGAGRHDDDVTESFPSSRSPSSPSSSSPSPSASSTSPTHGQESDASDEPREQRRARFDPLDPNWRPPLD